MSRKQVENLNRASWQCLGCQNIEANPRPQVQTDTDEGDNFKVRKTKVSSLNILQYNIDSISSKLEEFKMLLKEEGIEIFLLQETKLISKDNKPKYQDLQS